MDKDRENARHWQEKYYANQFRIDAIWNSALDALVSEFGPVHNPRCNGKLCKSCYIATVVDGVKRKSDIGNTMPIVERMANKAEKIMEDTSLVGKERLALQSGMLAMIQLVRDIIGDLR